MHITRTTTIMGATTLALTLGTCVTTATAQTNSHTVTTKKTSASACGAMTSDQALQTALRKAPPAFPGENSPWTSQGAENHYDPCASLSWITFTVKGATGSSPAQTALFHKGKYLGTATLKNYSWPKVSRINGSSIQAVYRDYSLPTRAETTARFTWSDAQSKVVMTGQVPEE